MLIAVAVLAVFLCVALLGFKPLVARLVVREALRHGVEISFSELELDWRRITLKDLRFRLLGLMGIDGRIGRLEIEIDGLEPMRFDATAVDVAVVGSAAPLLVDAAEWCKDHPELFGLPARAEGVALTWKSEPGEEAWLEIADAVVEPDEHGARLLAERAEVAGIDVGRVGVQWTDDRSKVALGFGVADLARAPIRIEVRHAGAQPEASIVLERTSVSDLGKPLGVALPIEGASVRAEALLRYVGGPIDGSLRLELKGYRPPVPREIESLVFGDTTELSTSFELSEDRRAAVFEQLSVKHGSLVLTGQGRVRRDADHAEMLVELAGRLSCSAIAASVVGSQLGPVGPLLAEAARRNVGGSVELGVTIEADSRDLTAARVARRVGVGCGLRLMGARLELPKLSPGLPPLELPPLPPLRPEP